ncbi:SIS domain-containing protein [Lactobacillus sp. B4005]|uniref:SIS domain-containing protein n=2 Tax=Lactobacillus TaxID=1578 RepID=UPI00226AFC81|nr:SIS domain-containing protein [Lactobacillus sp. B4005]MCX8722379.1 SIS domain-containing protein [Lactobacillus sp. B4005]
MNGIITNLKETPEQLVKLIDCSKDLFEETVSHNITKIFITGSGTSYHSGEQMQQKMREKSGIPVEAYYPFKLTKEIFETNPDNAHTLFIGISQEGGSLTTFNAMNLAKKYGCLIATMSGDSQAYINTIADEILTVDIGKETVGPKTKGYYATKLNLLLLAEYIGLQNGTITNNQFENDLKDLNATLNQFPIALNKAINWVNSHKNEFSGAHDIRLSGPAALYGDVLESTLKILETCRLPITGYEFNEFIHGIYNAVNNQSTLFFIDDGTEPKINLLVKILGEWTEKIYLVRGNGPSEDKIFSYGLDILPQFETFIYPIVFQVIAALVPEISGIDPSIPKDPAFHQKMGSQGVLKDV